MTRLYAYLAARFGKALAALILAGMAVLVVLALYHGVKRWFSDAPAQQAKVNAAAADAAIEAGAAAGNVVTTITANDTATDTTVKGGLDEIRTAPAASRNLAAQCAACRLRGSRGADQRCAALREARSCEPAPAR